MALARPIAVDPSTLRQREGEPRWRFLVRVLETCGPMTTGQLGHIYGIGQNVRGIRREANAHLRAEGKQIVSEPTYDADGKRLPWATYRIVHTEMVKHLERSQAEIAQRAELVGRHLENTALRLQRPASRRPRICASGNARPARAARPEQASLL